MATTRISLRQTVIEKKAPQTGDSVKSVILPPKLSESLPKIEEVIGGRTEEFGIYVYDFDKNDSLKYSEKTTFDAASTVKVLVAIYAFDQVERGNISKDTKVGNLTLDQHLRLLVNRSDNNSWEILYEQFGLKNIDQFGRQIGLENTNLIDNTTNAFDLGVILTKIARGEVLNDENRKELLTLMQNTETEDRISPQVPKDFNFYHKTGTFEQDVHDIAIIEGRGKKIVVVILTKGNTVLDQRNSVIGQIAKVIIENSF